jgi:hypothetical protein
MLASVPSPGSRFSHPLLEERAEELPNLVIAAAANQTLIYVAPHQEDIATI